MKEANNGTNQRRIKDRKERKKERKKESRKERIKKKDTEHRERETKK